MTYEVFGGTLSLTQSINQSPETRMIVLPEGEDRTIVTSFFWREHRNVTDRQTDGQTAYAITAVCIVNNAVAL